MSRNKALLPLVVLLLAIGQLLVGCSGDKTSSGAATAAGSTGTTGQAQPEKGGPSKPRLEDVPAELRHDAFAYYGLGNMLPVDMESKRGGLTSTGGRMTRLVELRDGTAVFEAEFAGSLDEMGTETLSLEKDGLYTTGISIGKMTPEKSLALPADLTPGKTWRQNTTIELANGMKLVADHTYKVAGIEKVKTKAGEFDALLITANGPTFRDGKEIQVVMKSWLVKDVGPVKMDIAYTADKLKESVAIEATKVNK